MLKKDANKIVGGLSKPSKMPGYSIGLPAKECNVGNKLRSVCGSVCSDCYAMKGSYTMYKAVEIAQYRRLEAITHPLWIEAMTKLISGQAYFRWHDSGDLQNMEHLANIVKVCENTPNTKHWLPTKEKKLIKQYLKDNGDFPSNLTVRLSAAMLNSMPPLFDNTSTVHTKHSLHIGHQCQAPSNGGKCGDCRACWNKEVKNVSYTQH